MIRSAKAMPEHRHARGVDHLLRVALALAAQGQGRDPVDEGEQEQQPAVRGGRVRARTPSATRPAAPRRRRARRSARPPPSAGGSRRTSRARRARRWSRRASRSWGSSTSRSARRASAAAEAASPSTISTDWCGYGAPPSDGACRPSHSSLTASTRTIRNWTPAAQSVRACCSATPTRQHQRARRDQRTSVRRRMQQLAHASRKVPSAHGSQAARPPRRDPRVLRRRPRRDRRSTSRCRPSRTTSAAGWPGSSGSRTPTCSRSAR